MSLFTTHFNTVLKFLAKAIRQDKEIKSIEIGKIEKRLPLFPGDMIIYVKYMKELTKIVELITQDSQVTG